MAETIKLNEIQELIPPNPAALDFEQKFRDNLNTFLQSMKGFETTYESTFSDLQGDEASLEDAIALLSSGSKINTSAIKEVLLGNGGTKDWIYTDSTGSVTVGENLEYASLNDKIIEIDNNIAGKADASLQTEVNATHRSLTDTLVSRFTDVESTAGGNSILLDNALKETGDGATSLATPYSTLESRFFASEDLLTKAYTIKKDTVNTSNSDTPTNFNSIEERFSTLEDNISSTKGSLSGYASISGDLTQDFNAATLKIGTALDLDSKPLINLPVPTNDADASTKKYVDVEILKRAPLEGDSTVLFKVKDVDPADPSHDNQHALSYGYAIANLANIAGNTTQDFDAQTLTVSAGLDMNSQFITNLPDPTGTGHAVNYDYLTANYTNTTDLVNNYAAIAGSATQDFDIQKLTVHDDVDMNSKLITNLPNPTGAGHAVNYDYLTANYTDNNALASSYAGINGSAGQAFDILDPNDDTDTSQDTWAISRTFADGRYAKQEGDAAINFNADTLTVNSLVLGSNLDMAGNTIDNLPKPDATNAAHAKYAASREYVDDVQILLSNSIGSVASNMVPTYGTPEDGKFLSVSSSGLIWVNPPTVDTSTPSYEWLSHPQVAFHSVQFEEQLYVNHTLAANRVYYVAGNLEFPDLMADGTTPCTSTLTAASGAGANKGATLIVQGHIIGDQARLIEDNTNTNLPRVIVQNWADSRADYVISGTVNTSDLNLTEDLVFASRLVLESGAVLNIDSGCNLTFKELVDNGGTINETSGSVNYFDPQKLIENAPAAVDTLKEIGDLLKDSATNSFINVADALNTHITGDFSSLDTIVSDHIANDFSALDTQVQTMDTAIQNLDFSVGNFTYIDPSTDADGDHVYKFSP